MNLNRVVYGREKIDGKYSQQIEEIKDITDYKILKIDPSYYQSTLESLTNYDRSIIHIKVVKDKFINASIEDKPIFADVIMRRYEILFSNLIITLKNLIQAQGYRKELINTSDRILRAAVEVGDIKDGMIYQLTRFRLTLNEMLDEKKIIKQAEDIINLLDSFDAVSLNLHGELSIIKTKIVAN